MSDRGYIALSLEVESKAVIAEIEAMKAMNADRENKGLAQAYGEDSFQNQADDLRRISDAIKDLV